jgi:hypothetical protein
VGYLRHVTALVAAAAGAERIRWMSVSDDFDLARTFADVATHASGCGATVRYMANDAGSARHSGWSGVLEAFVARFERDGIRLREMCLLYLLATALVIAAVVAFFVPLFWIFS